MNINDELIALSKRADLVATDTYKEIEKNQIEYIIDISTSNIDDKEIRGMLRLLKWTNSWQQELDNFIKNEKEKRNG